MGPVKVMVMVMVGSIAWKLSETTVRMVMGSNCDSKDRLI